jgi:hypothetical protein
MLNRNDRVSLRRNRSAVSWLCILCIFLIIWIINLKRDISDQEYDYRILSVELNEFQVLCNRKNKNIDSLNSIIKFKQIDTPIIKKTVPLLNTTGYRHVPVIIKKDTMVRRIDTNNVILKDTVK